MDDNVPDGNPPKDFNKIDLTQLQGFSFGTQWTQDKSSPSDKSDRSEHPGRAREGRSNGPGGGAMPDRRDRRVFRRPNAGPDSGMGQAPVDRGAQDRRDFAGRDGQSGPPRDQGGYRPAGAGRPRFAGRGDAPERRPPYESPYFSVTFYPEDVSFGALVKTVRASCRTIELFEIARTVLAKPERFTVSVSPRQPESKSSEENPSQPAAASAETKPALIHISVPDGLPFDTEEAAIAHGLRKHLGVFFDVAEVETEPPKGNFLVINRCSITGELLGPPNYHRYNQTMQQHFASKIGRMSIEEYRTRIESVRDPAVVQQWLDKMKKVIRYTWRAPAETPPAAAIPAGDAAPAPAGQPADQPAAPPADVAETPKPEALAFDTLEEARSHLLGQAKDRLVRQITVVRIHGRDFDALPPGEIRQAIEGEYERQSRFPLDTANALRGRLRREHFTIFKKGAKGVSYVCAVKRKFRVPGQTFSENIGRLISFIEEHPMIKAGELIRQFLGLPPAPPAGADAPAAPVLAPDQREKLVRAQADLLWLVREGYVTEFIDGSLYAAPPLVEAGRKEAETAEVDPENFPDIPEVHAAPEAEIESPEPQGVPLIRGDPEVQVPDATGQP